MKQGSQLVGIDRVEDCAHLQITSDAVDRAKIVARILSSLVKRQQRRTLQREHRQGRQQCVGQRNGHGHINLSLQPLCAPREIKQ